MKKKIGNLTLREIYEMCDGLCFVDDKYECPLFKIKGFDCERVAREVANFLDQKIEVEDNE